MDKVQVQTERRMIAALISPVGLLDLGACGRHHGGLVLDEVVVHPSGEDVLAALPLAVELFHLQTRRVRCAKGKQQEE